MEQPRLSRNDLMGHQSLVRAILPPDGIWRSGKAYYYVGNHIFEVDSEYLPIKPLGEGSYGAVCSAFDRKMNEKVAIKKISNVFANPINAMRTLREMMILRQLRHPNVVSLKDVAVPSQMTNFSDVYLTFEVMDTDLDRIIRSPTPFSPSRVKWFIYQILHGLHYIHSADVIHQDLKPANILVKANSHLKIGDFGLSRTAAKDELEFMTGYVVSRWYRAPEVLLGSYRYGKPIDVWSVGCIFAELLGRMPLFPGTSSENQLHRILTVLGAPNKEDLDFIQGAKARKYLESLPKHGNIPMSMLFPQADPMGLDLLKRMLVFNPSKRITAEEALRHPYLSDIYDPAAIDCTSQFKVKINIEEGLKEDAMRKLMWDEMVSSHHRFAHRPMPTARPDPRPDSTNKEDDQCLGSDDKGHIALDLFSLLYCNSR